MILLNTHIMDKQSYLQELIWKELVYQHPLKAYDSASYWSLAEEMLDDHLQPSWRWISAETKQKCNYKSHGEPEGSS